MQFYYCNSSSCRGNYLTCKWDNNTGASLPSLSYRIKSNNLFWPRSIGLALAGGGDNHQPNNDCSAKSQETLQGLEELMIWARTSFKPAKSRSLVLKKRRVTDEFRFRLGEQQQAHSSIQLSHGGIHGGTGTGTSAVHRIKRHQSGAGIVMRTGRKWSPQWDSGA